MAEQRTLDAERARAIAEEDAYPHPGDNPHASVHTRYTDRFLAFRTGWAAALAYVAKADVARRAPPALDAEELPALPLPAARMYVQNGYRRASVLPGKGEPLYAAEQVRQAQRDAVAADRRSRVSADQWASLEAARLQVEAARIERENRQDRLARTSAPEGAPVCQAGTGDGQWLDIRPEDAETWRKIYYTVRTLYAPTSASAQPADQPAPGPWQVLGMEDMPDADRKLDVILTNGVLERNRDHSQIDWTQVADWRYAADQNKMENNDE